MCNPLTISDEPLQFADYASWEAEQLESSTGDANIGRAFWSGADTEHIERARAGSHTALPLAVPTSDSSVRSEAEWLAAIIAVAGRHARPDAARTLIAVAVDGRTDAELEGAIGAYTRFVDLSRPRHLASTYTDLVAQTTVALDAARRFSLYAPRSTAPWGFQPALGEAYLDQDMTYPAVSSGGLALEFVCTPAPDGGTHCTVFFDPARMTATEAARIESQLRTLAAAAAGRPDVPVGQLPLLGAEEQAALAAALVPAALVPAALPGPTGTRTIAEVFADQVARFPDQPAVSCGDATLSYAELDAASAGLARSITDLVASGAMSPGPVGVLVERSVWTAVALLGIIRAGCAYLPLDPAHPQARQKLLLDTAGAGLVVASAGLLAQAPAGFAVLPAEQAVGDAPATGATEPVGVTEPTDATLSDAAYLIFTSGSTGTPKPVAVTHDNVLAYVAALTDRLGLTETDRLATVTEISTDLGNTSIFGALLTGAALEIVPREIAADGQALAGLIKAHGVTGLKITPSHLRALLAGGDVTLGLDLLILGGEALDGALVEQARRAGADRIVNHYGPTETTIGALTYQTGGEQSGPIPIGRPLSHLRAHILDEFGAAAPYGAIGQLGLAGPGVSAGYPGRPELTAEKFVTEPDTAASMYLTGDLVRLTGAGQVEFVGRVDDQVKIRGYRVELGEIEQRLRDQAGVTDAAVLITDDEVLTGFLTASDPALDLSAVTRRLAAELPEYMVPGRLLVVATLPRTAGGKLDRAALQAQVVAERETSTKRAPGNDVEAQLLEIWSDVLPVTDLGVDDNFFQSGGHSLLATKVIARSRAHFDVELPLHVIFAAPTVALLAAEISSRLADTAESEDELQQMLAEIEGMSDDEALSLLGTEAAAQADDD